MLGARGCVQPHLQARGQAGWVRGAVSAADGSRGGGGPGATRPGADTPRQLLRRDRPGSRLRAWLLTAAFTSALESHLLALSFRFLICKTGTLALPCRVLVGSREPVPVGSCSLKTASVGKIGEPCPRSPHSLPEVPQVLTPLPRWGPGGSGKRWGSVSGAGLPLRGGWELQSRPRAAGSRPGCWSFPRLSGGLCAPKLCGACANQGTSLPT